MSFKVGRIGFLALALSACSGVADPMGLSVAAGGDLQTVLDAGGGDAKTRPDAAEASPGVGGAGASASTALGTATDSAPAADGGDVANGGPYSLLDASDAPGWDSDRTESGVDGSVATYFEAGDAAAPATVPASCLVTFTVAGAFIDGVIDTGVAIGGDTTALGGWDPSAAVPMTSLGAGAWTVSLLLN